MLGKFTGPEGERLVAECLRRQRLVQGSDAIVEAFTRVGSLEVLDPGQVLIEQDADDNDVFFIIAGSFEVCVSGRPVARRYHGEQVGEMAMVDPAGRRSATVTATEESVVLRVREADFYDIAQTHPVLWRSLACAIGDRLRQRNELVRQKNDHPRIFIGSSSETLSVAASVQTELGKPPWAAVVWTTGVFGPSEFPIESLERAAVESDFGVLVLGPDDKVISRRKRKSAPRDNVILELGLFIGTMGHRRTFLLTPQGMRIKIPTDLLGITTVRYSPPDDVALACEEIRKAVSALGPR